MGNFIIPRAKRRGTVPRDGICTTRWFLSPDLDHWTYDHGIRTIRVAETTSGDEIYTWIAGGTFISKVRMPEIGDPLNITAPTFRNEVMYEPPAGAEGIHSDPFPVPVIEMRTINDSLNAVVIGTPISIGILYQGDPYDIPMYFSGQIIQRERAESSGETNFCGKWKIGFRNEGLLAGEYSSVGGFFRMQINQYAVADECGSVVFTNDSSAGSVAWTDPQKAERPDADPTVANGQNATSNYLKGVFDFSNCIEPSAQSIEGVKVTIERRSDSNGASANVKDHTVRLLIGGIMQGNNKADTATRWPTTFTPQDYGGASDLWGFSLVPGHVLAGGFGVMLRVTHAQNGDPAYVDQVGMTIYWTDSDGDPQVTTIFGSFYAPPSPGTILENIPYDDYISPSAMTISDFITEPIPFDISGADLAAIIQDYLLPQYTVSGTGSITDSTDITLTFTHDGSIPARVTDIASHLVAPSFIEAYADEAATIHMLSSNDAGINWSKCASTGSNIRSGFSGSIASLNSRGNVGAISVNHADATFHVTEAALRQGYRRPVDTYQVNKFNFDGDPQDSGAYTVMIDQRDWRFVDSGGYGYSQLLAGHNPSSVVDEPLEKYGPDGIDAQETAVWSIEPEHQIQQIIEYDGHIYCAGYSYTDPGIVKVSKINPTTGAIDWQTDIDPQFGFDANDIHAYGGAVLVAIGYGAWELSSSTGDLMNYYPHGRTVRSAYKHTGGLVVLTGDSAPIDINPADYDIGP